VAASKIAEETTWSHVTRDETSNLAGEIAAAKFRVIGKGEFKEEFVTCGGVKLKEVDFRTMESRICPGFILQVKFSISMASRGATISKAPGPLVGLPGKIWRVWRGRLNELLSFR